MDTYNVAHRSVVAPGTRFLRALTIAALVTLIAGGCTRKPDPLSPVSDQAASQYTVAQTVSDEAQRNTIAFDALAFLNGCVGSQSFLPPGKVADFDGFQYLRDNDPTNMGHNTSFVTIVAFNMLHILDSAQVDLLVQNARTQVDLINAYAYQRFPLMKAFRRLQDGDLPAGCTALNRSAVLQYSAALYRIDGQISYNRARVMGTVLRSLSSAQRTALARLQTLNGVGNWDQTIADPLQSLQLPPDVSVAVMTFASEMYSWYAGSVDADVYFCPERQGTYFGSFYLKDWPAMGNPDYAISEQLTAGAGANFLAAVTDTQKTFITGLVSLQKDDLNQIVSTRRQISTLLRQFLTAVPPDSGAVLDLAEQYGQLDGEIVTLYATHFVQVGRGLSSAQRQNLASLVQSLGYTAPAGAFLYSRPIAMPDVENTDFLFSAP